jgi:hypothetical protein
MTTSEPQLIVKDLRVKYGPALALDGVSLQVGATLLPRAARKSAINRGLDLFPSLAARRATQVRDALRRRAADAVPGPRAHPRTQADHR